MLVEANDKCTLDATAEHCDIFMKSSDLKKRDQCVSKGTVVDEVSGLMGWILIIGDRLDRSFGSFTWEQPRIQLVESFA